MSSRVGQPPVYLLKAEFFRTLGHPARVRILQLLREGERTVGALQAALGLDSSGASQHPAALRRPGVGASRREGRTVHYRIRDVRILELLELAREILAAGLEEDRALLDDADFSPAP